MDHLPHGAGSEPIRVPYICRDMYDGGDFGTFPQRCGWTVDELQLKRLKKLPKDEAAAFLQSWLYFGFLSHVFKPLHLDFDPFDFVREDETGRRLVTTRRLPEYVLKWGVMESQRTPDQQLERFNHLKSGFTLLHRFTICYCHKDTSQWPLEPEICLSIIILADTLMKAAFEILKRPFNIEWGVSEFLVEKMKRSGWCIRAISTMLKGQQIHNLYYASTLGSPEVVKDHGNCNEHVCRWEQVVENEYVIKHRPDCEGCALIMPSIDRIVTIIRAGQIPGMRLKLAEGTSGQREIEVVELSPTIPYVAISHVCESIFFPVHFFQYSRQDVNVAYFFLGSDGMGNPTSNALPRCQINRIQAMVDEIMPADQRNMPCPWWCDTLCVPVGEENKEFRRAAIRNMRSTYQNAAKVLVFEASIMKLSKDLYPVEIYIRLKLACWMRRLWTLQEGVLGKDTCMQFADGTKTLRQIDAEVAQEGLKNAQLLYTRYSFLARTFFGPFVRHTTQATNQNFANVWKTIQWRSTTHRIDETLCLATLLGLDPAPLFTVPDTDYDRRMIKLLQMVKTLPLILFFQPPPRLSQHGFRWAPKSFLNCFRDIPTAPFRVVGGKGEIGPNMSGLSFRKPGLAMLPTTAQETALPMPSIGELFKMTIPQQDGSSLLFGVYYHEETDRMTRNVDGTGDLKWPAVIAMNPVTNVNAMGVLVDIVNKDTTTGTIEANFIALISLFSLSTALLGPVWQKNRTYVAENLPQEQSWLVY